MYTSSGIVGFGQAPVLPSELPGGLKAGDPCPSGWVGTVPMCIPATYPGDQPQPQPQPQPQNLGCKPNETPYNYQGIQLCIPDCPEGQIPLHMPDGTIACQTPTQPEPDPNLILPSPTPGGDQPAQPEPKQGGIGGWWNRRDSNEKLAIGVGGGVLVVAVFYSMFGKKKTKTAAKK